GNPHSAGSGEKILSGYIRSINTGEPITQATIRVVDGHISVQPDQNGFYSISLPPGSATLQVSSVGKSDAQRQLLMYDHGRLDIELDDVVYALSEVVVSAEKGQNLQRTAMGVERISVQTIRQTPAVLGEADVVKVVLSMPGVQTVSEASGGFNVRGGATDQNLVLFSDATVFNPSHFFGFFSSFNADVVNDVELYKSSIPARYGGRLSSVLNITAKSGTKNKISGSGGIGLLTGRLSLEGPIGEHSTFVVGGRSTYSDWLLDLLPNDDYKNSAAGFYDVNLYFTSQLTEKDALYVMGYFSNDRFKLRTDTTYHYQNQNFNLKWNRIHSNNLYSVLTVGYDGYSNGIQGRGNEFHAFDWDYGLEQIFGRLDFSHRMDHKHNLTYGLQSNYFQSQPGIVQPVHSASILLPDQLQREQALETSLHINDNITLNEKIGLDLGLRYTLFQFLGPHTQRNYEPNVPVSEGNLVHTKEIQAGKTGQLYHGPEFRVGMRYTLSPASSLKLGYNSMNQYIHMLSNTTSITPTDTWKLSDSNIKPQRGDQIAAGYYHNFRDDAIETSVEAYYKRMHDYLDYKSGATLVMNHRIEQDVVPTAARAYGLEFLIRKNTGKLNGWISYAYARVKQRTESEFLEEMINRGAYYPSNHDKPHSFNLVGNYRVSHRFSVSVNSQYSTGRPITLPIGKFNYAGGTRVIYSDRNQYRIPDYFRVDLALNIEGNHKVRKLAHSSWSVGVYNLTGRENPFSVYFLSEGQALNGYKLSVFGSQIPFVTYNFKF
ncbi:MAG TPA: carboxypeptidase-like regulatory domain-containing protein, partial [Sphingobacteriaceae bacterium]|nr:carboxypeptidase-like regulatory domain-containing protein [Sphingobacteriaceae bacterium]